MTVGVALLTSLALALTWTPTLSHYFLRAKRANARAEDLARHATGMLGRVAIRIYERVLRFVLEHPLVVRDVRIGR